MLIAKVCSPPQQKAAQAIAPILRVTMLKFSVLKCGSLLVLGTGRADKEQRGRIRREEGLFSVS